jgi:hypothetical protein
MPFAVLLFIVDPVFKLTLTGRLVGLVWRRRQHQ